ncbi:hypothetical protein [Mucilaginibacter pedocola]|nr:hypothetical protein [Mucilaginibacter pedocola]
MKLKKYFGLIMIACLCASLSFANGNTADTKTPLLADSLKKAKQNPLAPKKSCCKGSPSKAKMLAQQKKKKQ